MNCRRCQAPLSPGSYRCRSCKTWTITPSEGRTAPREDGTTEIEDGTFSLASATIGTPTRYATGPWDSVFGGGVITGGVAVMGGTPGAGKSTFAVQMAHALVTATARDIVYVATEESMSQIRAAAYRLVGGESLKHMRIVPFKEGFQGDLGQVLLARKPAAVVVDSISGLTDDHRSAVDFCKSMKDYAVDLNIPIVIIDHATKENELAGLLQLQHVVDQLITLFPYVKGLPGRLMRGIKNRFGPETEVCLTMTDRGLAKCEGCAECAIDD